MKTIINILGVSYYLWIRGNKDQETGEYQDFFEAWNKGDVLNLAWHITLNDDRDALRVSFVENEVVMVPREETGSVYGYIWCSKEGMAPRGDYTHGLVGMRYGWEKAKATVFFNASSLEFTWRLAVSKRIHQYMEWKAKRMTLPAPMAPEVLSLALDKKTQLFKTKIADLTFREKMQRYLRKSTTAVYKAIIEEFTAFSNERQVEVLEKLTVAAVSKQEHIAEIIEEFAGIVLEHTEKVQDELPAQL